MRSPSSSATVALRVPARWAAVCSLLVGSVFHASLLQATPALTAAPRPAPARALAQAVGPTAAGGCAPNAGRILQQVCENGVVNAAILQFEQESIEEWLRTHEMPLNQASMLYQYGRSDLRSELRAWMLQRIVAMAYRFWASDLPVTNWFAGRAWDMEKAYWDKVVQLRDLYLADKCGFSVDPEIVAQTGSSYAPPFYCTSPGSLISLFATDAVPSQDYFLALALKVLGSEKLDVDGTAVYRRTIGDTALFAQAAGVFAVTAALAALLGVAAWIGVSVFFALGTILFAVLIPVMLLIAAAIKFVQVMDDAKNLKNLMALNGDRDFAYQTTPSISEMTKDPRRKSVLLLALTEASLPEFSSVEPPPARAVDDLPFNVTPEAGPTQSLDHFTWTDWDDQTWSAYASTFWLVGTRDSDQEKSFGASVRYRNWAGEPYMASRMGRRFLLVKRDGQESDKDCPPDTLTGLSTETGGTCKSWVATEVQLKDAAGQNVTVALPADPAFLGPDYASFRNNLPAAQTFTIQSTGAPLPTVDLAPGALLPAGITFQPTPPRIVMAANTPLAAGSYTTTLRATNSAGFVDRVLSITVADQLAVTSPGSVTVQIGVPFSFQVQAAGSPPLALQKQGLFGPVNVSFTDHGNGTGTFAGTVVTSQQIPCFYLDNLGNPGPCGIAVTESGGAKVVQPFSFNILPAPAAHFTSPLEIVMDRGIPNSALVTATNDFTSVGITQPCGAQDRPAWLAFTNAAEGTDVFNGNAYLSGTPPLGTTEEELEIYLHAQAATFFLADATSDGDDCASQAFAKHKIRLVPRPHFTGPSDATIDGSAPYVIPTNMPPSQAVTVSGELPPGITFDSDGRALSGPVLTDAGGIYNLVFRMTNDFGSAELPFSLTVLEPPSLSSANTVTFVAGHPNQYLLTAYGFPRATMTYTPLAPLPTGFTFSQQQDVGVLEGTPAPGTYQIPIRLQNGDVPELKTDVTLTVNVLTAALSVVAPGALQTSEEGQTDSFTVSLTSAPSADVTVTVASTDATEGTVAPPTLTFTNANWSTPQTAIVTGADDDAEDGAIAYQVTFSVASDDPHYNGVAVAALPATNLDDDGDSDGDGVNDKLEDLAPNGGDGNGDGIDDAGQPSVVSIQSFPGTAMLTLASSCPLTDVMVTDEQLVAPDAAYAYPFGLIAFRAACSSATFSLFVHTAAAVPTTYRKYGPVPAGGPTATWYTLPGATFSSVTIGASAATRINFAITDGGLGDDTAIDGVIVDQGGPGDPAVAIPLFGPHGLLLMSLLMAFAAAWVLGKGRA